MNDTYTELTVFNSLEEATIALGFLQANGIDAVLADAHTHAVLGAPLMADGVKLLAPQSQLAAARALLAHPAVDETGADQTDNGDALNEERHDD